MKLGWRCGVVVSGWGLTKAAVPSLRSTNMSDTNVSYVDSWVMPVFLCFFKHPWASLVPHQIPLCSSLCLLWNSPLIIKALLYLNRTSSYELLFRHAYVEVCLQLLWSNILTAHSLNCTDKAKLNKKNYNPPPVAHHKVHIMTSPQQLGLLQFWCQTPKTVLQQRKYKTSPYDNCADSTSDKDH